MLWRRCRRPWVLLVAVAVLLAGASDQGDEDQVGNSTTTTTVNPDRCPHERYPEVRSSKELFDGKVEYQPLIRANQSHLFFYSNYNLTTMNLPDVNRKLIINLEPCNGVVYLFVRKTRPCYPNPYSCIDLRAKEDGELEVRPADRVAQDCEWTHFMSKIDGTRDATPTFFELPLASTKYYITVFATRTSRYTLTVLADTGAFPRPGLAGKIEATQQGELQVKLTWNQASLYPRGVSSLKRYQVYGAMLLEDEERLNPAVFVRESKIMNSVCGLTNNTDTPYTEVNQSNGCVEGICEAIVDGVIKDKRYAFNVVAESERGFRVAYAGVLMKTSWRRVDQIGDGKSLQVVGAILGGVLGFIIIIWLLLLRVYG